MKRKLVKQGENTLTISLPSAWVNSFGLKPGDEVELNEENKGLLISTSAEFKPRKSEIDISGLRKSLAYVYITDCYIRGDDEIKVRYDSPELLEVITGACNSLLGFAIIEQGKNYCILKDLSGTTQNDFDMLFRRILLLIGSMGDSGLEALKKKDIKSLIVISKTDEAINKFTNYCLRSLNRKGYRDFQKTMHYYTIIALLEQLGDEYARLYKGIHAPVSRGGIKLFEDFVGMSRKFSTLFHKYDKAVATDIFNTRDRLREMTLEKMNKPCINDVILLYRIRKMTELMADIIKLEIGLHI
ncbi:MAG: AbrB/MazE/SpoVT family DNA-binding domain-containing protein [Nanoarchaeota archaeon]|nr:AbrB/MazE/SpoVT family DNA-binding domain-containing protein [Nanoarchaeota archaeon]